MLTFHSANVRTVNTERAAKECVNIAFPNQDWGDCRVVMVNTTMGHRLDRLAAAFKEAIPGVSVLGASAGAVTGRSGVGESMNDVAAMMISGPPEEFAISSVKDIFGHNSYEKALELAKDLKAKRPEVDVIYLMCPGLDIDNMQVLRAFTEVFGEEVTVFGGTSSDNSKAVASYQYHDDVMTEFDAWAIGFADKTLRGVTRATHGFTAYGEPMVVTKSEGNRILELDGKPAWERYTERLNVPVDTPVGMTMALGALGEELPGELVEEYGNSHILRVMAKRDGMSLCYPTTVPEGLKIWLTLRDEELIFSEQERSLEYMKKQMAGGSPVAVFQTDCLARGRLLFNKVVKDEIIGLMQSRLSVDGEVPPWLGFYGLGEYTKLGGKNMYHNYTTALLALYRDGDRP